MLDLPGVSKGIIERHEDVANVAFVGLAVLGVAALAFLIYGRRKAVLPRWMGRRYLRARWWLAA